MYTDVGAGPLKVRTVLSVGSKSLEERFRLRSLLQLKAFVSDIIPPDECPMRLQK